MRKGERGKRTTSDSSFPFPAKSSTNLPHPAPSPPFEESVTGRRSSFCFCAPSISLIVSFSSHASPYCPPSSSFHSSSVHPSLSPGLASVGRFQSVCLLMTPLGADVMLSSCCSALQHHPRQPPPPPPPTPLHISLCLPSNVSNVFIYLHVFLFPATPVLYIHFSDLLCLL